MPDLLHLPMEGLAGFMSSVGVEFTLKLDSYPVYSSLLPLAQAQVAGELLYDFCWKSMQARMNSPPGRQRGLGPR